MLLRPTRPKHTTTSQLHPTRTTSTTTMVPPPLGPRSMEPHICSHRHLGQRTITHCTPRHHQLRHSIIRQNQQTDNSNIQASPKATIRIKTVRNPPRTQSSAYLTGHTQLTAISTSNRLRSSQRRNLQRTLYTRPNPLSPTSSRLQTRCTQISHHQPTHGH